LVSGVDGDDFRSVDECGRSIPGVVIYRFEASLVFFNADYFNDRVRAVVKAANSPPKYLLIDAESVPLLDVSGAYALEALHQELAQQGIEQGIARTP